MLEVPIKKTPLRIACDHGQLDTVRLLAKRRAMIDCRDEPQRTPLHAASEVGDNDIARLLLQSGANKAAKDSHMRTPLRQWNIKRAAQEQRLTYGKYFPNASTVAILSLELNRTCQTFIVLSNLPTTATANIVTAIVIKL